MAQKNRRDGTKPSGSAPALRLNSARRLLAAAAKARKQAVAPYSKFKVGAALLTPKGDIITGANVESASYGLTCCAEGVGLFKALTEGFSDFVALAVVAPGGVTPCGACRQLIAEYAPKAKLLIGNGGGDLSKFKTYSVDELLPVAFERGSLGRA